MGRFFESHLIDKDVIYNLESILIECSTALKSFAELVLNSLAFITFSFLSKYSSDHFKIRPG